MDSTYDKQKDQEMKITALRSIYQAFLDELEELQIVYSAPTKKPHNYGKV